MKTAKVYVDVLASFSRDGDMRPVQLVWEDGRVYDIDRIIARQEAAARRYGGAGVMYTCLVEGRESHIYYEENNRWFVERKGE